LLVVPPPTDAGPATAPVRETLGDTTAPLRLLLALTAGPLGGVTAGPTGELAVAPSPDRLVVSGPQLVLKDRLLQVAVLTQTGVSGDTALSDLGGSGDPTLADLPALLGQYASRVARSWREALDTVFTRTADTDDPSGAVVEPDATPMESPPDQDSNDPDEVDVRPPAGSGQWAVGSLEAPDARSAVAADAAEQNSSLPTVHRPQPTESGAPVAGGALAGALAAAWLGSDTSLTRQRRRIGILR
jgi:hypothetical protein